MKKTFFVLFILVAIIAAFSVSSFASSTDCEEYGHDVDEYGYCLRCGEFIGFVGHDCERDGHIDSDHDLVCDICGEPAECLEHVYRNVPNGFEYTVLCPSCGLNGEILQQIFANYDFLASNLPIECPRCHSIVTNENIIARDTWYESCIYCGNEIYNHGEWFTYSPPINNDPVEVDTNFPDIDYTVVLSEVVGVLPAVLGVVLMYIAIRKGLAFLERILHRG